MLAQEANKPLAIVPKVAGGVLLLLGLVGVGVAQLGQKPQDPSPKEPAPPAKVHAKQAESDPLPANAIARFGTSRFRPGGSVTALAFEPSGKRLASWSESGRGAEQFTLWDAETGKELRANQTASNSLVAFSWPSNGIGVTIVSEPHNAQLKNLKVWEFSAEKPTALRVPTGDGVRIAVAGQPDHNLNCQSAAISADGKRIAIATAVGETPGTILIFEAKPNSPVTDLKKLAEFAAAPCEIGAMAFAPDGKRLVALCPTGKVKGEATAGKLIVWNSDGKIEKEIETPKASQQGSRVTFCVSNEFAALGLEEGDALLIEIGSGKSRTIKTAHKSKSNGPYGTYAVAISHNGKFLGSAGRDGMVRVSDIATGKVTKEFGVHGSWPEAVTWSADDSRIASAGQDAVIRLWDAVTGKELGPTNGNIAHVWRASISDDGKTAITDGGLGIRVWDSATGAERRRINPGGNVTFCGLSPDTKHVVAIVGAWEKPDRAFRVWDIETGDESVPGAFPKTLVASGFRFAPDGQSLITYHDEKLTAWTWPAGNKLWMSEMPKPIKQPGVNQVQSVAFSPDGRQFITVGERYWFREERGLRFGYGADGIVDLWDSASGKMIRRLVESNGCFRPGRFAANGFFIHSGGGTFPNDLRGGNPHTTTAPLCALDPLTGRMVREFGKAGRVDGFDSGFTTALSADGKVLFHATGVGEIHLYEVSTGSYRTALVGHKASVLALDAPTDVRRVLSGSWDTSSLLWDVGLCSKKGAKLSDEERRKFWDTLKDTDGTVAYEGMIKFGGDPDGFLAIAKSSMKPAPEGPKSAELNPIFAELDSKTFARREAASAKLDKYGESAIALVRARLEAEPSAEVRDRLKRFLEKNDGPETSPSRLQNSRAVEILEHLATTEAKVLLAKLAGGGASYLTVDAQGAVRRIERR